MEFEFQINLRRMSLFATALSSWNKNDVQIKFKQYLCIYNRYEIPSCLNEIINEVIKKTDRESLPDFLYWELVLVIKKIGYIMSDWFHYLKRRKIFRDQSRKQIYAKLFKKIYWTHYGTINEEKILRYYWLHSSSNIDLFKVYVMACCYCLEDVISDLWGKISQSKHVYKCSDLCSRFGFHLVAYWNKLRENDLETFKNDVIIPNSGVDRVYDASKSVAVNMLHLSIEKGYVLAFKHFWNKITPEEKENNLIFFFNDSFIYYDRNFMFSSEYYRKGECVTEISIFLMNFMTENEKRKIFEESEELLNTRTNLCYIFEMVFCSKWPWQEFFPDLFKKLKDLLLAEQYKKLINSAISEIVKYWTSGIPIKLSITQKTLHQLWLSTPFYLKEGLTKEIYLPTLLTVGDISSMKLILNDEHVSDDSKMNALNNIFTYIERGEVKDEFFFEFVNEIVVAFKEFNDSDQEMLKSLYKLICRGELESAREILDCHSEEKKVTLKDAMNHELMCRYLIVNHQYDTADQFLKWKFEDSEKIKKIKEGFCDKKFAFIRRHIRNIWDASKENVDIAKRRSQNFLLLLFESDMKVLSFKLNNLLGEMLDFNFPENFYWTQCIKMENFEILEDFLCWCSLNVETIYAVKKHIAKSYWGLNNLLQDCMKKNDIKKAEKVLNWAFIDFDDKKSMFMREFLLSKNGLYACKYYVGKHANCDFFKPKPTKAELTEKFKKFINFFIKPYLKDFDELKFKLNDWPEISDRFYKTTVESDASSSDDYFTDCSSGNDENRLYCDVKNYKLFISLLNCYEHELQETKIELLAGHQ